VLGTPASGGSAAQTPIRDGACRDRTGAPFGHQQAVFATSDPIWAMFYAVVDHDRFPITLANGCIVLMDGEGRAGVPHYFFSISRDPLRQRPWRTGYLYFLPAEGFVEQPPDTYGGHSARVPQLASPVAVAPLAGLEECTLPVRRTR
jgi:hypothetical protein